MDFPRMVTCRPRHGWSHPAGPMPVGLLPALVAMSRSRVRKPLDSPVIASALNTAGIAGAPTRCPATHPSASTASVRARCCALSGPFAFDSADLDSGPGVNGRQNEHSAVQDVAVNAELACRSPKGDRSRGAVLRVPYAIPRAPHPCTSLSACT
jgi:hypothetical protein